MTGTSQHPWSRGRLALALVVDVLLAAGAYAYDSLQWPALALAILLLASAPWWLAARLEPQNDAGVPAAEPVADLWRPYADLTAQVLPLWRGHTSLGNEQITEAIGELATRFSAMGGSLQHALGKQDLNVADREGLTRTEDSLRDILEQLKQAISQRDALQKNISELKQYSNELQGMADAVSYIAGQTNLLALNAAIEAARAGEAGRGFAVVADEVRKLSQQSDSTGKQIGGKINAMVGALERTISQSQHVTGEEKELTERISLAVNQVIDTYRQFTATLDQNHTEVSAASQQILQEIQQILVSLQFQDRVSQILGHVLADMQKLESSLERALGGEPPPPPDVGAWLAALKKTYTTQEQHSVHHGTGGKIEPAADDVTFF